MFRVATAIPWADATALVPPAGFEPAHTAPEADALSPELRGLGTNHLSKHLHARFMRTAAQRVGQRALTSPVTAVVEVCVSVTTTEAAGGFFFPFTRIQNKVIVGTM